MLLVPRGADCWSFPCYAAADDPGASILDVCNVVGAGTDAVAQHIGNHHHHNGFHKNNCA
eukprot:COSAG04_NODE_2187_length_4587_cov_20.361773_2_plen_60_part_00